VSFLDGIGLRRASGAAHEVLLIDDFESSRLDSAAGFSRRPFQRIARAEAEGQPRRDGTSVRASELIADGGAGVRASELAAASFRAVVARAAGWSLSGWTLVVGRSMDPVLSE